MKKKFFLWLNQKLKRIWARPRVQSKGFKEQRNKGVSPSYLAFYCLRLHLRPRLKVIVF